MSVGAGRWRFDHVAGLVEVAHGLVLLLIWYPTTFGRDPLPNCGDRLRPVVWMPRWRSRGP